MIACLIKLHQHAAGFLSPIESLWGISKEMRN
jgi:hypothetical protein